MSVIKIPDNRLDTFYKQNPDFDILRLNGSNQAEVSALHWQGLDQAAVLDLLKKYQRLLRLHPDPAVAKTLLGASQAQDATPMSVQVEHQQLAVKETVATATVQTVPQTAASNGAQPRGLDSAQAIAALPKEQFVQQFAPAVGGAAVATQIHQNATTVTAKTMLLWANVQNLVASPHFRALRVNNVGADIQTTFSALPDYEELFGSLDFCQCDECRSIFSPAAYMVDLLRIIDQSITTPNTTTIPPNFKLDERRPDIGNIPLTCENTNTLVPFLDVVNTILATKIAQLVQPNQTPQPDSAYATLATAMYPFNLPFNLPLEQIRGYLGQLNTDLATLYNTFNVSPDVVARETLRLSIEEYTLITTPKPNPADLTNAYGVSVSASDLGGLANQDTFLKQTGLSRQDLQDLLTQNLSANELSTGSIPHMLYINQLLASGQYLQLATDGSIKNLDLPTLDRLHRFIRLARKLNWSFADLDWVLCSLQAKEIDPAAIQSIAGIKQLQARLNLPLNLLCSFWSDLKTIGVGTSGPSQTPFDIIFNNPRLLGKQAPYHPRYLDGNGQPINPLYTDPLLKTPDASSRIAAGLRVSLDDMVALVTAFWGASQTNPTVQNISIDLTVQNISILYRHAQLAQLLKLPIDQYLLLLGASNQQEQAKQALTIDGVLSLLDTVDWRNKAGFNVYELGYIVYGNPSKYVDKMYRDEEVQPFLQMLRAPGISTQPPLNGDDILDWPGFIAKLNDPSQTLARVFWNLLAAANQQLIVQAAKDITSLSDDQKATLVQAINMILQNPALYQQVDMTNPAIPQEIRDILQTREVLSANQWQKLNRLLLEAAFPQEIARGTLQQVSDEWKENLVDQLATFFNSATDLVEASMELITIPIPLPTGTESYIDAFLFSDLTNPDVLKYLTQCISTLSRQLILNQKLQLTSTEIDSMRTHHACYGITLDDPFLGIRMLYAFKQLMLAFQDTQNQLVGYFNSIPPTVAGQATDPATMAKLATELAAITGWSDVQITEAATNHFQDIPDLLTSVAGLVTLKTAFDLNVTMGVDISFHDQVLSIATLSAESQNWAAHTAAAAAVIDTVKARYNDDDWANVSDTINNPLNEAKRSALAGFVLWKLGQQVSSVTNLRTLSEYLLIDVETSGCASISLIKQALLSLQMYVQRCRLNLEPGVTSINIPDVWWEWIMNYGIWEANRKVFLYPENYIDPSLRKSKSNLFQELQSELLQSDITQDSVATAYLHYFDKLIEVANLRNAASYRCFVPQPNGQVPVDTLFLFGRTATEPVTYYYRACQSPTAQSPTWTPWSKIDVPINADDISPVFAFNKLFVFWVEITETKDTSITNNQTQHTTVQKANIKYIFQTVSQTWGQPQTLAKDLIINITSDDPGVTDFHLDTEELVWKKVYPLALPGTDSEPEQILVMFGDLPLLSATSPQQPATSKNTDVVQFDQQMYAAQQQGYSAYQNGVRGYSSLVPAAMLSSALTIEETFLLLPQTFIATPGTLSQARFQLAATSVGNLALFAGGTGGNISNAVDIYNAATGQWTTATLSQARNQLAATSVGNLALFAGGTDASGNNVSNTVDIYNAATGQWTTATLSQARNQLAATSVGNLALFAGGVTMSSGSNTVDIYNAATGQWTTAALSQARLLLTATSVGNLALFAGGVDASGNVSNAVDIYNAATGQWTTATLSQARNQLAATSVSNLALFAGGVDASGNVSNTVDIYNAATGQWTTATLSQARFQLAATSVGNLALFAGGTDANHNVSNTVDIYNAATSQWTTATLSQAHTGLVATSVGNLALFAGGFGAYANRNVSNVVDIFDTVPSIIGVIDGTQFGMQITDNIVHANYTADSDHSVALGSNPLLKNIARQNALAQTVKNQPDWSILDNGDEAFLVTPQSYTSHLINTSLNIQNAGIDTVSGIMIKSVEYGTTVYNQINPNSLNFVFARLTTSTVRQLSQRVLIGGIDQLLTLDAQATPELDFTRLQPSNAVIRPASPTLDFNGAYGLYFQEIFFHIPFLVANTLNTNQRFAEAQKWYQYIFNPTLFKSTQEQSSDRFWRYLPFQGQTLPKLEDLLQNDQAIAAYNNDPFDPQAIAQLRISAYQKAIVMKYIDNLLDWGDSLFAQDTWESIAQATLLYFLAYDLLGPRPENLGPCPTPAPQTFNQMKAFYGTGKIPQFLLELEQQVSPNGTSPLTSLPFNAIYAYFGVSENDQFIAYWDRVEDRLYKIRHCENIAGVVRQLALFEPPINPAELVRAAAAGNVPLSVVSGLTGDVPHYRFDVMLERARNITSTLIQLGATLLSALEKSDAEQLSVLRATQESAILRLIQTAKQKQIDEANANLGSLNKSLEAANHRITYYQNLLDRGLSAYEQGSQMQMKGALIEQLLGLSLNLIASPMFLIPIPCFSFLMFLALRMEDTSLA